MARMSKSTKKFEKVHLGRTLEKRKEAAKKKQLYLQRDKKSKRKRREELEGEGREVDEDAEAVAEKKKEKEKLRAKRHGVPEVFDEMSVEQFFKGGFEVPEQKDLKKLPKKKVKKAEVEVGKKRKAEEEEEDDEEEVDDEEISDISEAGEDDEDDDAPSGDEIMDHKAAIAALAEKDPEFFKYLKENDKELLDFTAPVISDDDSDDGASKKKSKKKKAKKAKNGGDDSDSEVEEAEEEAVDDSGEEITKAHVTKWTKALVEENSLKALRKVVLAFRAAVHVNENRNDNHAFKYTINNPQVYNDLMLLGLKHIPTVLLHHLPIKESASGKVRVPTDSKKFTTLTPLIKSHTSSLLTLLPTLTDPATLKMHLNSCATLIPYVMPFRKLLKALLKAVVDIWSTFSTAGASASDIDESVRITAFLVVRRAMVVGDEAIKETCLKALYSGFVKAARNTNVHTLKSINLMKNSAAETLGLPGMEKVSYVVGFGYIRQLAVHLRNSITNNSKESYKTVYNWQYVHSLDFWSRVLSTHCAVPSPAPSTLQPLIYPLVQVTLGAARLIPTATYFPLRFHLIRSLIRISSTTDTYIPLAPLLFEVLSSTEMRKKPKPASIRPLDWATTIRCPKGYSRTRVYQDGTAEQLVELLGEFLGAWAKSVAFPELATPIIVGVKRWIKRGESGNSKVSSWMQVLIQKVEANSNLIVQERAKLAGEIAPSGLDGGEGGKSVLATAGFLAERDWERMPLGAYLVAQRKIREEKRRMLEEAMRDEGERRRRDRKGEAESSEEEESDGEMDLDDDDDEEGGDESD